MAIAFGVILASVIIRRLVVGVVISSATRLARKTRTELDNLLIEALRKPLEIGIIAISIGIATTVLGLPREPVDLPRIAGAILTFGVTVLAAWTLFRLIDALSKFLLEGAKKTESKIDDTLIPLFRKAAKIFVAVMAFVVAVQNLGYSISGLLAGLGIGGLAIALAARDTLANVFGSITILIDKPFKVGDWVSGPGFEGVVEEIGFRSTRIRTFHKTLISIPNNTLVNMTIDNRQAMPMRRMDFVVGVTYDTTVEQMRRALEEIRNILVSHEGVDP
ncbi:MAG: mechanosensitive ion channel family protein, partial [Thermoproteota archaeon]